MDTPIFRVLARAQGEYSMMRRDAAISETVHLGALLLSDFDADRKLLHVESHLCDEGEWVAFYLRGVTQLNLFRDLLDRTVLERDRDEAGELARCKLTALRALVGQLTLRPTEFWDILDSAGLHDEELTMLALLAGRRTAVVRWGDAGQPRGQLVLDFDGLLNIFTRREPVRVLLSVSNVSGRAAVVSALEFSELPSVPVRKSLRLVWDPQHAASISHKLLDAHLAVRPVRVTAHPAATLKGALVALEFVAFHSDVERPRRGSLGLRTGDWASGSWPMPDRHAQCSPDVSNSGGSLPDLCSESTSSIAVERRSGSAPGDPGVHA